MVTKKAPAKKAPARPAKKAPARKAAKRLSWLDDKSVPQIDGHARKTEAFVKAMADGTVDEGEIAAQEKALVATMKEVEGLLDDELHAKVTRLLCELTVYSIMQVTRSIQECRPATRFRG